MKGSRYQLLSRAGFAANQNRCVGSRDRLHFAQNSFEGNAVADDLPEIVLSLNLFLEVEFFFRQSVARSTIWVKPSEFSTAIAI